MGVVSRTVHADRIVGALLGVFVGDALGSAFEGAPPDPARRVHPPRSGPWYHTDDTEMTLALAEHLAERDQVEPEALARTFLDWYGEGRGYGGGTRRVFTLWRQGVPIDQAADQVWEGGSRGNGAAMRVAPIGARFWADPQRIVAEARAASRLTHTSAEAVDGAVVTALAVGVAVRTGAFGPGALADLAQAPWSPRIAHGLSKAADLAREGERDTGRVLEALGNEALAARSVPTALWAAALATDLPEGMELVVPLGGDADTIAAMAGGVLGAAGGASSIPRSWLDALEQGPRGLELAIELGRRLAARAGAAP